MTTNKINNAIAPLGLEIVRGKGYVYFVNDIGAQVGESLMIPYLCQLTLSQWIDRAQYAKNLF